MARNISANISSSSFVAFAIFLLFATTLILVAAQYYSGPLSVPDAKTTEAARATYVTLIGVRHTWAVVAFLADLVTVAAIVFGIGYAVTGQMGGIALSSWNDYSLSKLQMALWSIVVIAGLLTSAKINLLGYFGTLPDNKQALDIAIPPTLLAAMGIAAFNAAAAPAILSLKASQTPDPGETDVAKQRVANLSPGLQQSDAANSGKAMGRSDSATANWLDIVTGDETANAGLVDLSKVQQLLITLLLLGSYCAMLLDIFAGVSPRTGNVGGIMGLPDVGENFVQLLAVSSAGYLLYKTVPKSGQDTPPSTPTEAEQDQPQSTQAAAPIIVSAIPVRLAVTGADDPTTIRLVVDGQPAGIDQSGFTELVLSEGDQHTIVATGTAGGGLRQSAITITPTSDDVNAPFEIGLT